MTKNGLKSEQQRPKFQGISQNFPGENPFYRDFGKSWEIFRKFPGKFLEFSREISREISRGISKRRCATVFLGSREFLEISGKFSEIFELIFLRAHEIAFRICEDTQRLTT